jgi:hypothetical protein
VHVHVTKLNRDFSSLPPNAGLSATSAEICASRWEVAVRLGDLNLHGVTTAPRHRVTQDDLLLALQGEEAAAALWQHLGDEIGEHQTLGHPCVAYGPQAARVCRAACCLQLT